MATGKSNMEHVKNRLLDVHTHIAATYDSFCLNNEIRSLFTVSSDASSAELGIRILKAQNRINGLWDSDPLNNTVFTAIGKNGHAISSDDWGLRISNRQLLDSPIINACRDNPNTLQYVALPVSIMGSDQNAPSLVAVRSLKTPMGRTPFGILLVQFSQAYFNDICQPFSGSLSHILITDANGRILSGALTDSRPFFSPFSSVLLQNHYRGEGISEHIEIENSEHVVLYQYIPYMNLYVFHVINKDKIAKEFYSSISGALLLAGLLTTIILFLAAIITRGITNPLKRFTTQLLLTHDSRQNTRLPVEGSRETRQLAEAYNRMADELKYYNEKLMNTEKKRHEAELTALQLQINPHFLYNTLGSIQFLAFKGKNDSVGKAIHSLITMLHNTLGNTKELITVGEQMENLKHYTDIMSLRYDNTIPVFYVIHPNCLSSLLPKLLLQPLVENAFFHAFDGAGGYIKIFASLTAEGRLICEIMDNGKGFGVPAEFKENIRGAGHSGMHIGLANVKQRLSLIYGDRSSFTVISQPGRGTLIKIELPCRL